ncbi:peroxisomal biogenesis factor 11 [Hypoxylon sp. FL0890]|nr:peroxisomal biogenesis factor 11 [Hypoxylon sp. FL0890]
MSVRLEQFIKFTTDSVGLERTFRLFQATVQILASFAIPFDLLLYTLTLSTGATPSASSVRVILKALNQRLGLARRFFRLFRFLESFNAAHKFYFKLSSPKTRKGEPRGYWVRAEPWLDVFARTFNGMYLLLEASTIVDALQIPGLAVWTPEWERTIAVEAQRFWLFSLVCGCLYNVLEIPLTMASMPPPDLPASGAEEKRRSGSKQDSISEKGRDTPNEETNEEEAEEFKSKSAEKLEERSRIWRQQVSAKTYKLGRAATANALDIILPGSVVGWVKVEPGTVGLAMFVTTILTGMEVWERCGREVSGI